MSDLPLSLFKERADQNKLFHLYSDEIDDETIAFWKQSVLNYCAYNGSFSFKPRALSQSFTVHGIVPVSLDLCIQGPMRGKEVAVMDDISTKTVPQYLFAGAFNVAGWLISTAVPLFSNSAPEEMICLTLLEKACNLVLQFGSNLQSRELLMLVKGSINSQCSLQAFVIKAATSLLSNAETLSGGNDNFQFYLLKFLSNCKQYDIDILLNYLIYHNKAIYFDDKKIIQLLPNGNNSKYILLPNDIAFAILKLKTSIEHLEEKVTILEARMKEEKNKALIYKVKLNNFNT